MNAHGECPTIPVVNTVQCVSLIINYNCATVCVCVGTKIYSN